MSAPGPFSDSRAAGSVAEQASDWISRRERGFSAEEQAAYAAWRAADPSHAAAAADAERSFDLLHKVRRAGQGAELRRELNLQVARRRRRRWIRAAAWAGLAAAMWFFFLTPERFGAPTASVASGRMQLKPERRTLADGSIVELNAAAEIAVDFQPDQRKVRLLRGTAHFAVAKNPARPFIVTAGNVSVRAVGTEFSVQFEPAEVQVLVTEGRVAVARPPGAVVPATAPPAAPDPAYLTAGQRAVILTQAAPASIQVQPAPPQAIQAAQAWRSLRVEFTDMRLREVVDLFNRRNPLQLLPEGKGIEDLLVSGIFWLDDPEGFSRLIAASAGLKPRREGQRIVLGSP